MGGMQRALVRRVSHVTSSTWNGVCASTLISLKSDGRTCATSCLIQPGLPPSFSGSERTFRLQNLPFPTIARPLTSNANSPQTLRSRLSRASTQRLRYLKPPRNGAGIPVQSMWLPRSGAAEKRCSVRCWIDHVQLRNLNLSLQRTPRKRQKVRRCRAF